MANEHFRKHWWERTETLCYNLVQNGEGSCPFSQDSPNVFGESFVIKMEMVAMITHWKQQITCKTTSSNTKYEWIWAV